MGELLEICGQNGLYLWHLSSVQGLSDETLCGYLRVQRKNLVFVGVAYMRVVISGSTIDPLIPNL